MGITKIPHEVTELALVYAHPRAVSAFSRTCRSFHALVYSNDSHLWRLLWFAQGFEDPRLGDYGVHPVRSIGWRFELQRRVKVETIARRFEETGPDERLEALQTLVDAIQFIPPHAHTESSGEPIAWIERVMQLAGLYERPVKEMPEDSIDEPDWTIYETEKRANKQELELRHRLHAYLGPSYSENDEDIRADRRNEARSFVYDLRNYNERNGWGPLVPNHVGKTNWMHVDHVIEVITRNLDDQGPQWGASHRPPIGFNNVRPYSAPGSLGRRDRDWAGVEGKWRRIVCFMDYRQVSLTFSQSI